MNTDIMVGLPGQDSRTFLNDIETISHMGPDQVTIYPFMAIRGVTVKHSMPEIRQFELIENACAILSQSGYTREGVWTLPKGMTFTIHLVTNLSRTTLGSVLQHSRPTINGKL